MLLPFEPYKLLVEGDSNEGSSCVGRVAISLWLAIGTMEVNNTTSSQEGYNSSVRGSEQTCWLASLSHRQAPCLGNNNRGAASYIRLTRRQTLGSRIIHSLTYTNIRASSEAP